MKRFGASPDQYFDEGVSDWPLRIKALNWVAFRAVLLFSKLYWHWRVDGEEPFPSVGDGKPGRVYVSNHASMFDPAFLVAFSGVRRVSLRPLYKSELDASKFVSWFFSRVGAIPVRRGTADTKAIKRAVNALKRGENVLVFPEGTRVWDPDARPEIFGGFTMIATMAGSDVVPIAIDGSELINPNKRYKLPRPSHVRIRFGKPLSLSNMPGESRREKTSSLEKAAMEAVYTMRANLRASLPAGK